MMFVAHVRCIRENGTPVEVQLQRPQLAALMEDIVAVVGDGANFSDVRAVRLDQLPPVAKEAWIDASIDQAAGAAR
jgi:hypothetical protein